jgi:hypothetical protein
MKASEDLRLKNNTNGGQSPSFVKNTTSLSNLKSDDKKQPSAENISSLKNALSSVLTKSSQKDLNTRSTEDGFKEKTETSKIEQKITIPEIKKENEENKARATTEVPEKVLRELLN